ncbi:unnamed protein product, partial [Ectocarpus sp. 12 AP-2014]
MEACVFLSRATRGSIPQAVALSTTAPLVVLPCFRLIVLLTSVLAASCTVAAATIELDERPATLPPLPPQSLPSVPFSSPPLAGVIVVLVEEVLREALLPCAGETRLPAPGFSLPLSGMVAAAAPFPRGNPDATSFGVCSFPVRPSFPTGNGSALGFR